VSAIARRSRGMRPRAPSTELVSTATAYSHLVLGGARSGKSRHAVELGRAAAGRVVFMATAEAGDADMAVPAAPASDNGSSVR
jgi:Cobinamide kinase / cobinamide phosphate guanyltransferase